MGSKLDSFGRGQIWMAYGVALVCGAVTAVAFLAWFQTDDAHADSLTNSAVVETLPIPSDDAPLGPPIPEDHLDVLRGEIEAGESLHSTLTSMGISAGTVHEIAVEMRPEFDFRYSKPGDRFRLVRRPDGSVMEFEYRTSATEGYRLHRVAGILVAHKLEVNLVRRVERLSGVVANSVYNAIRNLGESGQLAHDFSELFAWELDFTRDVRPGDEFRILYERLYQADGDGNEVYVGPGQILAAQYRSREVHTAIHYGWTEDEAGYYRPDGSALERQFVRAPLKYTRITSPFSWNRLHPILRVRRPHLGVDYAAPYGTPVWSVADGEIVKASRMGGMGKTVRVKHANGFVSTYGHLQRYALGLKVGTKVKRKQVIGYVGSTGLATGPHVHYDLKKNGKAVNPKKLHTPPAPPIPEDQFEAFAAIRDASLAELDPTPIAALGEAL